MREQKLETNVLAEAQDSAQQTVDSLQKMSSRDGVIFADFPS